MIIQTKVNTHETPETQSRPSKIDSNSITHQYEIWTATADIVTLLSSRNSRREMSLLMCVYSIASVLCLQRKGRGGGVGQGIVGVVRSRGSLVNARKLMILAAITESSALRSCKSVLYLSPSTCIEIVIFCFYTKLYQEYNIILQLEIS